MFTDIYQYCFIYSIYWCILDGADCNRQFIKLHFKDDPATANFIKRNPYTGGSMVFIMDCKVHVNSYCPSLKKHVNYFIDIIKNSSKNKRQEIKKHYKHKHVCME